MISWIEKQKLIQKGAEASLFAGKWLSYEVVFKYRIPKKYRLKEIDYHIRTTRTLNEARALIKVKNYGINVPIVYEIDVKNSTIVMKYIKGEKLKKLLNSLEQDLKIRIFYEIGKMIAILHKNGHIHGDITTSNILVTPARDIFLIDFGLHDYSDSIEDKSVDLHLFKRVLISSHGDNFDLCFSSFLVGYIKGYGNKALARQIIKNVSVIETRGRYVKKEERL